MRVSIDFIWGFVAALIFCMFMAMSISTMEQARGNTRCGSGCEIKAPDNESSKPKEKINRSFRPLRVPHMPHLG